MEDGIEFGESHGETRCFFLKEGKARSKRFP